MEPAQKRVKFVGGNWKCKLRLKEAEALIKEVYAQVKYDSEKVCTLFLIVFEIFRGFMCSELSTFGYST
jgi:triosephosphate isomerase